MVGLADAHSVQLRCLADHVAAFALDVAMAGKDNVTLTVTVEEGGHVKVQAAGLDDGSKEVTRFVKVWMWMFSFGLTLKMSQTSFLCRQRFHALLLPLFTHRCWKRQSRSRWRSPPFTTWGSKSVWRRSGASR